MAESLTLGYLKRREDARREEFRSWMAQHTQPQPAPDPSPEGRKRGYLTLVEDLAPTYGVDPVLAMSIIEKESRWNPQAVGGAGEQGLMQLMPATAKRFGVRDPFDPEDNIRGGLRYLAYLQKLFPGDRAKQLAGYNAGEGAVQQYGGVPPYPSTQQYVGAVLTTYQGGQPYVGKQEQAAVRGQLGEALTTLPAQSARLESPEGAEQRALTGQPPTPGVQEGTTVQVRPGAMGPQRQTMQPVSEEEAAIFEGSYTPPTAVTVEPGRLEAQQQPLSPVLGPALEPGLEEPRWQRVPARVAQGTVRAVASVLNAVPAFEQFVGIQTPFGNTAQDVAQLLEQAAGGLEPTGKETGLIDRMAEVAGGQIAFFGAGVTGTQALQFLTAAAPRIVRAVGLTPAAIAAVTEAGAEAGQTYEAMRPLVGDQRAAQEANTVFWRNVWLLTLTNKLGIFGGAEKPLARVLAGGAMEGVQEVMQYDIQRRGFWVPAAHPKARELLALGWQREGDRVQAPFDVATAAEAGVLGAVMGGGLAGLAGEIGTERAPRTVPGRALLREAQALLTNEVGAVGARRLMQTQVRQGYGTETPGAPLRVYHGTPATFDEFDVRRQDVEGLYGPGFYFTEDPTVAGGRGEVEERFGYANTRAGTRQGLQTWTVSEDDFPTPEAAAAGQATQQARLAQGTLVNPYTEQPVHPDDAQVVIAPVETASGTRYAVQVQLQERTAAPNVRPAYLDIRHPFDIDRHYSAAEVYDLVQLTAPQGMAGVDLYEWMVTEFRDDKQAVQDILRQGGYDGITHEGGGRTFGTPHRVWIAFTPEQVVPVFSLRAMDFLRASLGNERGGISLPQFPAKPSPPRPPTLAEGAAGLEPSRFRDAQGRWRITLQDMPAEELEIQDFIRQQGGIRLEGEELQGELRALISRRETGTTGLQNNVTGRSLQHMAERAQEFGFTATADKTSLLEALDRSVRQGIEVYSVAASGTIPLVEDPTIRALYEELTDLSATYQARVETQRRGVQSRTETHARGAALLTTGQWTVDDILEIEPGTVLDAETTSALVQGLFRMGKLMQQKAVEYLESGAGIGSPEEKSFLQGLALFAEADPIRLGVMAELGRGLGILNDPLSGFNRFLNQFQPVLASMGEQSSRQLARRIAVLQTPEQAAKTVQQMTQPGLGDMLLELWINGMLSSPRTHMVNFVSNSLTTVWALPERFTAGVIGSTLPGGGVSPGEVTAQWWGLVNGMREGWRLAAHVLRTGERAPEVGVTTSKLETRYPKAVTAANIGLDPESFAGHAFDLWAEFIGLGGGGRLPSRALLASDEFFRAVNYRMELAALTYRQARGLGLSGAELHARYADALANPEAAALRQAAQEFAILQTLQRELPLGSWGAAVQGVAETTLQLPGGVTLPVGRALIPFIRTPVNLTRWATERTPLGAFYREMWDDLQAGGARRDLAAAKVTLGTLTMTGVAGLALSGLLTGRGPEDKRLRETLLRTGWQPYSLHIGNTYIGYDRFDPFGLLIGMVADVVQVSGDHSIDTGGKALAVPFFVLARGLTNKTYMSSLAKFFDAVSPQAFTEPGEWAEGGARWLRSFFASAIPGLVATGTSLLDPYDRDLWDVFDGLLERTPWTVDGLPLARDRWGYRKLLGWGFDETWVTRMGRALTPLQISQELDSPIDRELDANHIRLGMPGRVFLPDIGMVEEWRGDPTIDPQLTPEQYERYVLYSAANVGELHRLGLTYPPDTLERLTTMVGRMVKADPPQAAMSLVDVLDWMITTPRYLEQSMGPMGGRERFIRDVAVQYQQAARQIMLDQEPELKARYEAAVKIRALHAVPPAQRQEVEERYDRGIQRRDQRLQIGR